MLLLVRLEESYIHLYGLRKSASFYKNKSQVMNKQNSNRNAATGSYTAPTDKELLTVLRAFGTNDVYYESSIQMRIDSDLKQKEPNLVDVEVTLFQFSETSDSDLGCFEFSAEDIFKIEEVIQDAKQKIMKICPIAASLCK
jgi:hypothetical protein